MNKDNADPNLLSESGPQPSIGTAPPAAAPPAVQPQPAVHSSAMSKDNLLFLMAGLLVGFVTAYLFFEAMATRQPPRLTPQLRAQIVSGEDGGGGTGAADQAPAGGGDANAAGAQGGGAPMAQVQQLRDYVEKNPNDADAVHKLADLNAQIQNWSRAQELYTHYLELKPNDPDVMTDLGIAYLETQQYDKALDLFRRSKQLAPDHWQSLYNEVVALMDLKKNDEAVQVLTELQKMQPGNPDVARLAEAVARQRNAT